MPTGFRGSCPVTQEFGENPNSTYYGPAGHPGRDYGCVTGTPVRACRGGQVTHADWLYHGSYPGDQTRGYGIAVIVRDDLRREWLYGHGNSVLVSVGQTVALGDTVMLSGNTGASTGSHLHLELAHQWDAGGPGAVPIRAAGAAAALGDVAGR